MWTSLRLQQATHMQRTWVNQHRLWQLGEVPRFLVATHTSQRHPYTTQAHSRFGQDRITRDGELVTAPSPQPQQQQQPAAVAAARPATAPPAPPLTEHQLQQLAELVHSSRRLLILTGAGCSTESDIPDYRGPNGAYSTGFKPMTHQQFMASAQNRSRYWARSYAGWVKFSKVQPNAAHEGIARLQRVGWAQGLITQNVDRLHHKAGSPSCLELHGTTHEVVCMGCGRLSCREEFQALLSALNPSAAAAAAALAAQADAAAATRQDALRMMRAGTAEPLGPSLREHGLTLRPDGEGEEASAPALHMGPNGDADIEFPAGRRRPHSPDGAAATRCSSSEGINCSRSSRGSTSSSSSSTNSSSGSRGSSQGRVLAPGDAPQRPDGDTELGPLSLGGGTPFVVPPCPACGGILKPNVVFFGDSIPHARAEAAAELARGCDAMLVVGSSVQVYSAFRLTKAAKEAGARLAVLTAGPTRADALADLKLEAMAGAALSRLAGHPWLQVKAC